MATHARGGEAGPSTQTNPTTVEARTALEATRLGLLDGIPGDLVASDVRQALHHLGSITGEIDPEDILDHIFSNFCIGK